MLGVVLFFVALFSSPDVLGLAMFAIPFGTVGTVSAISYEKWVEYLNHPVKSAVWLGPVLPLLQIGFAALTVLGVLPVCLELAYIIPVNPDGVGSLGFLLLFTLFPLGAVGSFVVWLVSRDARDKRAGPPGLENNN